MTRVSGIVSGRFCKDCDNWFKPTSKYNYYCNKCRKQKFKDRVVNKRYPIPPSKELKEFREKYGIK